MTASRKLFYDHEHGLGDEESYYLARDNETGRIFVECSRSLRKRRRYVSDSEQIDLATFLAGRGTAQDKLLALIGSLIPSE
jgi:hypothetical protein